MKNFIFCCTVFVTVACKKDAKVPESEIKPAPVPEAVISNTDCYQAVLKKDTITLRLDLKGTDIVSGKLTYNFFEKDKSDGTITGKMHGDTLYANYIFTAEGQTSQSEVAFLKKGETFIEGYGDISDDGKGKVTFKNKRKLNFGSNTVLHKIACPEESLK
ncbi:MAG: hypothetical protein CFE23_13455 [Flavobacterium sp. BFFFF1]|uniref:hypothetical protein n=1 Tax=Flavobacterium sp. BFFFF1 TaxID=2015557 RepID=UPI000BD4564C|nr:hypothetical protein [Flavobacterium sp. BFFFF1]OYU79587.1 MAG: hypothetical protein CFE23_13455 [Flavobacterium sp. BFFFF1]